MIDYVIEIENFNLTMINVEAGVMISSKMFLLNRSQFSVGVKKVDQQPKENLSVFLTNHNLWMVSARSSLWVGDSRLYREKLWTAGAERFCGKIPFSRCTIEDLLTPDGCLKVRVRIKVDDSIQVDGVEETPGEGTRQVKCPVCLRVVVKPMRLQQCPQVRLPSNLPLYLILSGSHHL